jgi:hypothetical protein
VLLRLLREPRTGRPGLLARLIAVLVVIGLLAVVGPSFFYVLVSVLGRFVALLG